MSIRSILIVAAVVITVVIACPVVEAGRMRFIPGKHEIEKLSGGMLREVRSADAGFSKGCHKRMTFKKLAYQAEMDTIFPAYPCYIRLYGEPGEMLNLEMEAADTSSYSLQFISMPIHEID